MSRKKYSNSLRVYGPGWVFTFCPCASYPEMYRRVAETERTDPDYEGICLSGRYPPDVRSIAVYARVDLPPKRRAFVIVGHECVHAASAMYRELRRRKLLKPRYPREEFLASASAALLSLCWNWLIETRGGACGDLSGTRPRWFSVPADLLNAAHVSAVRRPGVLSRLRAQAQKAEQAWETARTEESECRT